MEFRLDSLTPGMQAVVTRIGCPETLARRLADFGLVEGTRVSCRYHSPGGGVLALELRGTVLAIRKTDLRQISARRLS